MNTLYLRNVITEGPDKGYGEATKGYVKQPERHPSDYPMESYSYQHYYRQWEAYNEYMNTPGILVHPSYLENHKVGWMPDDWEYDYQIKRSSEDNSKWRSVTEYTFNGGTLLDKRKVIVPRSSNVEDAGEVDKELSFIHAVRRSEEFDSGFRAGYVVGRTATHPLQGEDKRDSFWTDDLVIKLIREQPEFKTLGRTTIKEMVRIFKESSQSTTPPAKEGERVEKEAGEILDKWLSNYPWEHRSKENAIKAMKEFAALSTRGKDAVEFYDWMQKDGIAAYSHFKMGIGRPPTTQESYDIFLTSKPQSK